jgi:hypothetical protein
MSEPLWENPFRLGLHPQAWFQPENRWRELRPQGVLHQGSSNLELSDLVR